MSPRIAELNPVLSRKYGLDTSVHVLTDGELREISDNMVRAACLAADAGFDFVDVKCCHGYLLHELLGAHTRSGDYGGSFENRTRLFRDTVTAIQGECPELMIGCRVSITDTYPMFRREDDAIGYPKDVETHLLAAPVRRQPARTDPSDFTEPRRSSNSVATSACSWRTSRSAAPTTAAPAATAPTPSDGYLPPRDPLCEVQRHLKVVRTIRPGPGCRSSAAAGRICRNGCPRSRGTKYG